MRYPLFYLLLLFLLPVASLPGQSKIQNQLKSTELKRFEAMTHKDVTFLGEVLSDDLSYAHSNGLVETKAEHINHIQKGALVYKTMEPDSLVVRTYRKSAIITGNVHVTGTLGSMDFDVRLHYTDMYIKRKGKWKLAAWQSVRIDQ